MNHVGGQYDNRTLILLEVPCPITTYAMSRNQDTQPTSQALTVRIRPTRGYRDTYVVPYHIIKSMLSRTYV